MMGRLNREQEQLFYSFCLDEVVPDDHLVRAIAAVLDLSWVHAELASYYPKIGRPSVDPVLMIRMLIIGYGSVVCDCAGRAVPSSSSRWRRSRRTFAGSQSWSHGPHRSRVPCLSPREVCSVQS